MSDFTDAPCTISRAAIIAAQRAAVVTEARTWIGTPYHPHGRVKGAGADCATFLAEAFARTGVVLPLELPDYPPDWHLHRSEEKYLRFLLDHCERLEEGAPLLPADIVMWRFGRTFSHGSIVTEWPRIIHAYIGRRVSEDDTRRTPWLTTIGENVPEKGRPRPRLLYRPKVWLS